MITGRKGDRAASPLWITGLSPPDSSPVAAPSQLPTAPPSPTPQHRGWGDDLTPSVGIFRSQRMGTFQSQLTRGAAGAPSSRHEARTLFPWANLGCSGCRRPYRLRPQMPPVTRNPIGPTCPSHLTGLTGSRRIPPNNRVLRPTRVAEGRAGRHAGRYSGEDVGLRRDAGQGADAPPLGIGHRAHREPRLTHELHVLKRRVLLDLL